MGYKCSFMDNEVYSAQDVNERFSMLFTSGVSLAESGNILADLNGITEDIAEYGVLQDACKVIKTDTGFRICAGTAIMSDGSAITFDTDGYDFEVGSKTAYYYVYLMRNEPKNTIEVVVSETAPTGDFVPLCEVCNNSVFDRRRYAKLKLNSCQSGTLRNFYKEFYPNDSFAGETYDLGDGNFSYVIIWEGRYLVSGDEVRVDSYEKCILPIADGEELEFTMDNAAGRVYFKFYAKKNGQFLETRIDTSFSQATYAISFGVI